MDLGSETTVTAKFVDAGTGLPVQPIGPVFWESSNPAVLVCSDTQSKDLSMKVKAVGLGIAQLRAKSAVGNQQTNSSVLAFVDVGVSLPLSSVSTSQVPVYSGTIEIPEPATQPVASQPVASQPQQSTTKSSSHK